MATGQPLAPDMRGGSVGESHWPGPIRGRASDQTE